MKLDLQNLKYPIGPFVKPERIEPARIEEWIQGIADLPLKLRSAVSGLSDEQLDTPYRPGGWTIRQVVHHIPDSHMNSYVRFKLGLTEEKPTIRPYHENLWAELPEAKDGSIETSLDLLSALHIRWVVMLRSLSEVDLGRTFVHPESREEISLAQNICHYAWHGSHHLGHIESLKIREHWN